VVVSVFRSRRRIRLGSAQGVRAEMSRCYKAAVAGEITSQDAIRLAAVLRHIIDLDVKLDNLGPERARAHAHESEGWDDEGRYEQAAILAIEREIGRERALAEGAAASPRRARHG
jgi:hypothetical protein